MGSNLKQLEESPVIAVLRTPPEDKVYDIVEALLEGGITNLELTMQKPDSARTLAELNKRYGDRAWIGAGTVMDEVTAVNAIHAGAAFIFSPNYNESVVKAAKRYGVISIPGVLTPTEMVQAVEHGADCVKVFPASAFGPRYIKELKGPFPHIPIVPTGGIHEENIQDYWNAGAVACGMGSSLVDSKAVESSSFHEITARARRIMSKVK
ncbi:2-dehydro-3-deoxyphosphogluconate aldolase [Alteribacter lacisalsi]|uniref:2-dehydro-3-deoxyphosphogluconate aldolase n=1 Tax=Alteribacter lacisalsi TaxID=2045244 RepID=A0A2W0H1C1_9BACI|nr:bifunctional 4-hydroxy-2-oxoglutarate aldolase/2-dehydro-3-deoxy-phosphogluconate aldolase [Alteribacter lacisalsi]PYZ95594.1 2-dehydro-3-deoxyphosphogluconate aldolase [Alteribacter lacisalsi]